MQQSISIHTDDNGNFVLGGDLKLDKLNPKELLLYSTALCAGLTLQSITEKERVKLLKVEIKMSGKLDTEKVEGRSQFTSFDISYNIECKHIEEQTKVSHAVQLTTDKYCGGLNMLRKIAPVSHSVSIVSIEVSK
ncbi:MAG: OsmC family protein [Alistipes sp.]|nr:OsmC family protein [Alistipes sp.]